MNDRIAIIAMACVYPDANSPEELWENVLTQRRSMRRIPMRFATPGSTPERDALPRR